MLNTLLFLVVVVAVVAVIWWSMRNDRTLRNDWLSRLLAVRTDPPPRRRRPGRTAPPGTDPRFVRR